MNYKCSCIKMCTQIENMVNFKENNWNLRYYFIFFFPRKKGREVEKEKVVANPVLNQFSAVQKNSTFIL